MAKHLTESEKAELRRKSSAAIAALELRAAINRGEFTQSACRARLARIEAGKRL